MKNTSHAPFFQLQKWPSGFFPFFEKGQKRLVLSLVLAVLAASLFGQTNWNGSLNTDWHEAANWSAGVPDADDVVIIFDVMNDPTITTAALAKRLTVNSGAVLTIATTGSLAVDNTTATDPFLNNGTVQNHGTITVGAVVGVGFNGIKNNGAFTNHPGGQIQVDRSTDTGIINAAAGTFTNAATIIVGGIANHGSNGIYNNGTFHNNAEAEIHIDRSTYAGFTNEGTTNNDGSMIFGASNLFTGFVSIINNGTFNNNADGQIDIDRIGTTGVFNIADGSFQNSGNLKIALNSTNGQYGVLNEAIFSNNAGGQMMVEHMSIAGIYNQLAGTEFDNFGTITLAANNFGGVQNLASTTMENHACGQILNSSRINNAGTLTNSGLFRVDFSTSAHLNSGTFTNNGILEYPQGNPIPNVVNNEISVAPYVGGCAVSSVLSLGAMVDFSIASYWFLDQNLTMPAGTFDVMTNVFTNTNVPFLVPTTVYFSINDAANGCARTVSIKMTIGSVEVCDGIDNDCDGQIDDGVQTIFYADADGDGFGNPAVTMLACSMPSGFVSNSTDCDDADNQKFPGNPEVCNGIDDNCNGAVDEIISVFLSSDVPKTIPASAPPIVVTSTLAISGVSGNIATLKLTNLNITHTWVGDLSVTLTAPGGTVIDLFDRPGVPAAGAGCSRDNLLVGFDDAATGTAIDFENTCNGLPYAIFGNYQPIESFSSLLGTSPNGTWTLTLNDLANGDGGSINGWSLEIATDQPVSFQTFYEDADGDGFGNPAISQMACVAPPGFVSNDDDCDDADNQKFPGNPEVCDGKDNNCDGTIDEGVKTVFYADADGDGFGNPAVTMLACSMPSGFVLNSTDCDDGCSACNPNATEICDEKDNDCDGQIDEGSVCCAPPTAVCKPFTALLGANGLATVTVQNVDNGSTFECGLASISLSKTAFNCSEIGAHTVMLTVVDVENEQATCPATVTVKDQIKPIVTCAATTVSIGANENFTTVLPAQLVTGVVENCSIASQTVTPNFFNCSTVGQNAVVVSVTDGSGNVGTCATTVTVVGPVSTFSVADKTVIEGSPQGTTTMLFSVVRSNAKCAASVQYATADATAFAPEDYSQAVGMLSFWPNQASQTVPVLIKKDAKVELLETFWLNLTNPVGGTFGDNQAIGTIQNDDAAAIQIQNGSTSEGNIGLKNSTFTATILNAADVPISFQFSTADGSATVADNDYLPLAATTVTIPAGLLSQTFSIQLKGDTKFEPNETVNLNFSNVQASGRSVTLAQTARTATILNDDAASMAGKNDGSKSEKAEVEAAEREAEKFGIQHSTVSVFPNPTDDFLNVLLEKGEWQITVFDLAGKAFFAQKATIAEGQLFQIDASAMPAGVHFLKAQNLAEPEKTATLRWAKMD